MKDIIDQEKPLELKGDVRILTSRGVIISNGIVPLTKEDEFILNVFKGTLCEMDHNDLKRIEKLPLRIVNYKGGLTLFLSRLSSDPDDNEWNNAYYLLDPVGGKLNSIDYLSVKDIGRLIKSFDSTFYSNVYRADSLGFRIAINMP